MRPVIKRRREAGDHRSSTPRTETHTSLSVLSRGRRNPRVVVLPSFASLDYAVRFHGFRSGAPLEATRRHSRRFASGYSLCCALRAPLAGEFRSPRCVLPHAVCTCPCGVVCHGSASLHGTPPCFGRYEKGGRFPVPLRVLIPTLPVRPQRFRAWTIPTLSRPPSPGDRRSERSGCVRPRPVPQHLRVAWRGFR